MGGHAVDMAGRLDDSREHGAVLAASSDRLLIFLECFG
jgi:hypothetical protein